MTENDKELRPDVEVQPIADDVNKEGLKNVSKEESKQYDVAAVFLSNLAKKPNAAELMAPWTPEEERRVVRKLDCIVLPLIMFTNTMSAVDKVALGTAATFGLRDDLHLSGSQYSWSNSIIYFGCMLTVYPQLAIIQRFHIGRVFGTNAFLFAVLTFAIAGTKNASGLLAIRFLLGLVEGFGSAASGLLMAAWWKKSEHGWRTCMAFNTFSSVVNGLLSYAVQFYDGNAIARWRLLFIICGILSLVMSALDFAFLPSNSTSAWWLTERQRFIATQRVASNQTGIVNHQTKWYQIKEAFLDPKMYLIFLINLCLNIPNGGLIGFSAIIVRGLGFSVKQTTLLNIPNGVISWGSSLIWSMIAVKTRKPIFCTVGAILVCLAATIALHLVPRTNEAGSLVLIYVLYCYWAPYVVVGQIIMYSNFAGMTKKVAVYGIAYLGYCAGNLIGPQSFIADQSPDYQTAIIVMITFYVFSIVLCGTFYMYCRMQNKKKVQAEEEWRATRADEDEANIAEEWQDLTDKENPKFRYYY